MRGKRQPQLGLLRPMGNIPAYAGKTTTTVLVAPAAREHPRVCGETSPPPSPAGDQKEHPRVCGENFFDEIGDFLDGGTSPRMRGKHLPSASKAWIPRNIPAYAGKTSGTVYCAVLPAEHPRVCGENDTRTRPGYQRGGTSPRMRGKHDAFLDEKYWVRNIPAYAGKTPSSRC